MAGFWDALVGVGAGLFGGLAQNSQREDELTLARQKAAEDTKQAQQRAWLDALMLDLKNKEFALTAPQTRAKTSLQGDYLSSFKPPTFDRPAGVPNIQIQGGAQIGDNSRQLGGLMSALALKQQTAGDQFKTPEEMLTPPAEPGMTGTDALDSIMAKNPALAQMLTRNQTGPTVFGRPIMPKR